MPTRIDAGGPEAGGTTRDEAAPPYPPLDEGEQAHGEAAAEAAPGELDPAALAAATHLVQTDPASAMRLHATHPDNEDAFNAAVEERLHANRQAAARAATPPPRAQAQRPWIVTAHDVPLAGGRDAPGPQARRTYIDRGIPEWVRVPEAGKWVNAWEEIDQHERAEEPHLDEYGYGHPGDAHDRFGNRATAEYLRQQGVKPADYARALQPYVDAARERAERGAADRLPPDLDRRPYTGNGDTPLLQPLAANAKPGRLLGAIDTLTALAADGAAYEVRHAGSGRVIAQGASAQQASARAGDVARALGRRRLQALLDGADAAPRSATSEPAPPVATLAGQQRQQQLRDFERDKLQESSDLDAPSPNALAQFQLDQYHDSTPEAGGYTPGYDAAQRMMPGQVDVLRNSGPRVQVGEHVLPSVAPIRDAIGYKPGVSLRPRQVADNLDSLQEHVSRASVDHQLPPDLLNAVIVNESNGVVNAVSPTGALGVTQQVYAFSADPQLGKPINPFEPGPAIDRQAAALSGYLAHYGGDRDKALAAYNQGKGRVDKAIRQYGKDYLSHLKPEAENYVRSVSSILSGQRRIPGYFGTPWEPR